MATASRPMGHVGRLGHLRIPGTKGAVGGTLLVLPGIWGGIIPFIGPIVGHAYTPDVSWHFTLGRLSQEIL